MLLEIVQTLGWRRRPAVKARSVTTRVPCDCSTKRAYVEVCCRMWKEVLRIGSARTIKYCKGNGEWFKWPVHIHIATNMAVFSQIAL